MKLFQKRKKVTKPDVIAGFGKLAGYPEFIKLHHNIDCFVSQDNWYQKAYQLLIQQYGVEAKTLLMRMSNYHLLIPDGYRGRPIISSVFNSFDEGGRCYPFVISRVLEHSIATEFVTSNPLLYRHYLKGIDNCFNAISHASRLSDIGHKLLALSDITLQGNRLEILESAYKLLKSKNFKNYQQEIGLQKNQVRQIVSMIKTTIENMSNNKCKGIKIPLPNHSDKLIYIVFFLQFFEKLKLLENKQWQLYWQEGNQYHQAHLFLLFQSLEEKEWPILINSDDTNYFRYNL